MTQFTTTENEKSTYIGIALDNLQQVKNLRTEYIGIALLQNLSNILDIQGIHIYNQEMFSDLLICDRLALV